MGFSTDLFLMKPVPEDSNEVILAQLGFKNLLLNRATKTHGRFGFKNSIVIGRHKDYLVIFAGISDKYFRSETPSDTEKRFCEKYNQHELLALSNFEVANSYLYNYIVKGKRVRMKCGADGMGVEHEYGEIIPLEDEPYDPISIEDGQRVFYKAYEYTNKKTGETVKGVNRFLHDQVGGDAAFRLCSLITGKTYYENWEEGVEYFEYHSLEILDRLRMPYSQVTDSKSRFNFANRTRFGTQGFTKSFQNLVNPALKENGFIFNEKTLEYIREKEGFQQVIAFSSPAQLGYITFDSSLRIEVRTPHLRDWWLKEFGTTIYEPGKPNRIVQEHLSITTPFHLDKRHLKINGEIGGMTYDKIALILNSYFEDTIIPFFDFYDDLKRIAGIVHFDFLKTEFFFSLGHQQEAKWYIKDFLKTVNYPNYDKRYQWMIDHYQVRVKKFFDLSLEELNAEAYFTNPIPAFEMPVEDIVLDFSAFNSIPELNTPSPAPKQKQQSVSKQVPAEQEPSNWLKTLINRLFPKG